MLRGEAGASRRGTSRPDTPPAAVRRGAFSLQDYIKCSSMEEESTGGGDWLAVRSRPSGRNRLCRSHGLPSIAQGAGRGITQRRGPSPLEGEGGKRPYLTTRGRVLACCFIHEKRSLGSGAGPTPSRCHERSRGRGSAHGEREGEG